MIDCQSLAGLPIVWEGVQFQPHSLALLNREYCIRLIRGGLPLQLLSVQADRFATDGNPKYETLARRCHASAAELPCVKEARRPIWITLLWPPRTDRPENCLRWIVMQPWEFSLFPIQFVRIFEQADEVWTISSFCKKSFVASGIPTEKVRVIPCGVDSGLFHHEGSVYPLRTRKRLKFLFVGGAIFRKGIDLLIRAFFGAFTAWDDACLVIKDMGRLYWDQNYRDDILQLAARPGAPEIEYIDSEFTEEEMPALYRACTVLVSPYRGEGFLLPALEALSCGLPAIVTDGGPTDDMIDDTVGWRIPSCQVSMGRVLNYSTMRLETVGEMMMLESDVDGLIAIFRSIAALPPERLQAKSALARHRAEQWTWDIAAHKIAVRLRTIYGKT